MTAEKKVLIIAHRGESSDAPENSLTAINLAWERDADAVEVDTRLTRDKEIIAHHDPSTKRTGNKELIIAENFIEHLLKIDIVHFMGENWKDEKIPTINEILQNVPEGKILFLEIKSGEEILQPLVNLLKSVKNPSEQICFISFNIRVLKMLKRKLPNFKYYLVYRKYFPLPFFNIEHLIERVKKAGLDGIDCHFKFLKKEEDVSKVKESGLEIFTWTVNDLHIARKLKEWGVNGITTDRAGWLKKNLFV